MRINTQTEVQVNIMCERIAQNLERARLLESISATRSAVRYANSSMTGTASTAQRVFPHPMYGYGK